MIGVPVGTKEYPLMKALGGKGNVILLRYAVGSASTEEREEGFLEVMRRDFSGIKLISIDPKSGMRASGAGSKHYCARKQFPAASCSP